MKEIDKLCKKLEENVGAFITYVENDYEYIINFKFPFINYRLYILKDDNLPETNTLYEEIMNYLRSIKLV